MRRYRVARLPSHRIYVVEKEEPTPPRKLSLQDRYEIDEVRRWEPLFQSVNAMSDVIARDRALATLGGRKK